MKDVEQLLEDLANTVKAPPEGEAITYIEEPELFHRVIEACGPTLSPGDAEVDLQSLYTVGWHHETKALVIANVGATLYCLSERTHKPYLVYHQGLAVYRTGYGVEMVNTGLVGDVYTKAIAVRAESACSPSFLYGSQRCNCHHQWQCVQELAASFNPADTPDITDGIEFEQWVQQQTSRERRTTTFNDPGELGFVLMHLDCQNGMGSGYTRDEFVHDMYSRASMRHRGEYSCEQVHKASMAEAFTQLGLQPDPRSQNNGVGYQTSFIVLDFLGVNKTLYFMSNNPLKWTHKLAQQYDIKPVGMVGTVNIAGEEEAIRRETEFGHIGMSGQVTFEEDFERVKQALKTLNGDRVDQIKDPDGKDSDQRTQRGEQSIQQVER